MNSRAFELVGKSRKAGQVVVVLGVVASQAVATRVDMLGSCNST